MCLNNDRIVLFIDIIYNALRMDTNQIVNINIYKVMNHSINHVNHTSNCFIFLITFINCKYI